MCPQGLEVDVLEGAVKLIHAGRVRYVDFLKKPSSLLSSSLVVRLFHTAGAGAAAPTLCLFVVNPFPLSARVHPYARRSGKPCTNCKLGCGAAKREWADSSYVFWREKREKAL